MALAQTPVTAINRTPRSRKQQEPTIGWEDIGPKEAQRLLDINTGNRAIHWSWVASTARDMAAGRWQNNGESIKVSKVPRLMDGQHRLLAIVESGVTVRLAVVRGLEDNVQGTIDIGAKRLWSDQLHRAGEANATVLSAAVRFCWYLDNFHRPHQFGVNPSQQELEAWLTENPGIRGSIPVGARAGRSVLRYVPSIGVGLHYLFSRIDPKDADEFWDHLHDGDMGFGNAIYALRETLLRDLGTPHRMSPSHRAALTIKAWNAWRVGKTVRNISWRTSGKAAEPFPMISSKVSEDEEEETTE